MKINTLELSGFISCFNALRLPFGLEPRSISNFEYTFNPFDDTKEGTLEIKSFNSLDIKDIKLLSTLVQRGPEHAKCIRGINVYVQITAPVYWWCEMETYTVGHYRLASESTMHIDCKGLSNEELVRAKSEIPMGKELTKIDMFNYQNLRNIYFQRRNHRLPEWRQFCEWIETLPFSKQFITIEK